jgi:hypothetical protein
MDAESGTPITPSVAHDREVHGAVVGAAHVPDDGGSRVAEHRAIDGQKGGEMPPARADETVADGVDPTMDPVQASTAYPVVDRRGAQAESEELFRETTPPWRAAKGGTLMIDGGITAHIAV